MMNAFYVILWRYIEYLIAALGFLGLLIWIAVGMAKQGLKAHRGHERKDSVVLLLSFIFICISAIVMVGYIIFGEIGKDWNYVVNSRYETVIGTVVDQGAKEEFGMRTIYVRDDQGETIECEVGESAYELGQTYEIIYIPHTGLACIIRHVKE